MDSEKMVEQLMEKADKQLDYGSYKKAQSLYEKAFDLLSSPKTENSMYLEILAATADCVLFQGKGREGLKIYERIMKHPDADGNAYLHLRRGQIAYETDRMELAGVELKRALELGGEEMFEGEFEEYYDFATKQ